MNRAVSSKAVRFICFEIKFYLPQHTSTKTRDDLLWTYVQNGGIIVENIFS